jgi:type III secretory pathway component EscR
MMIVVMMMVMIKSRRRKAHSALQQQQQDCSNETLQMMTNSIHKTTRERERTFLGKVVQAKLGKQNTAIQKKHVLGLLACWPTISLLCTSLHCTPIPSAKTSTLPLQIFAHTQRETCRRRKT